MFDEEFDNKKAAALEEIKAFTAAQSRALEETIDTLKEATKELNIVLVAARTFAEKYSQAKAEAKRRAKDDDDDEDKDKDNIRSTRRTTFGPVTVAAAGSSKTRK